MNVRMETTAVVRPILDVPTLKGQKFVASV